MAGQGRSVIRREKGSFAFGSEKENKGPSEEDMSETKRLADREESLGKARLFFRHGAPLEECLPPLIRSFRDEMPVSALGWCGSGHGAKPGKWPRGAETPVCPKRACGCFCPDPSFPPGMRRRPGWRLCSPEKGGFRPRPRRSASVMNGTPWGCFLSSGRRAPGRRRLPKTPSSVA